MRTSLAALACHRLILAGTLLLGILAMLAIAAPTLTRLRILHDPNQQDMKGVDEDGMPLPLGSGYLLGTDNLGRDVLSRVIQGGRISLSIGVAAMLTAWRTHSSACRVAARRRRSLFSELGMGGRYSRVALTDPRAGLSARKFGA